MSNAPGPARSLSLDVFRGATVALMILVNNPGSWSHLFPPLAHAPWHGCTATDLVFPFFLFAVGNALALAMPSRLQASSGAMVRWVLRRGFIILALGLLLNAFPFVRWDAAGDLVMRDWSRFRFMGVLQRIALAWALAALIVWACRAHVRRVLLVAAGILASYALLCQALGAPGDAYSLEGFFGTTLDRSLLGAAHLYQGEGVPFDPEGLASTLPAVAQVLLGWWVGEQVRSAGPSTAQAQRLTLQMLVGGVLLLALAHATQWAVPLNKKLWTSPYVLHTTALAMLTLGVLRQAIEGRGLAAPRSPWAPLWAFARVFGQNALFVFVLSGLVPRALALLRWPDGVAPDGHPLWTSPLPWLYHHGFALLGPSDPRVGSLAFALANLAAYWLIARALDRRGFYIKV
jgi:predicted acyltransferase